MVTVTKFPARIAGVHNPVVFVLSAEHYLAGQQAIFQLFYDNTDELLGAEYLFSWNNGASQVTMTCVETPDNSGTQFPLRQGEEWDEWLTMVKEAFLDNALLSAAFDIEAMGQDYIIAFTAKQPGEIYSMSFSATGETVTVSKNTPGEDAVEKLSHKIGIQVWRRLEEVDTMIIEEVSAGMIVDGSLQVQYNIAEILQAHCSSGISPEIPGSVSFIDRKDCNPPYFIKYYEQYTGYTPELLISPWMFSLYGGIPEWKALPMMHNYDNLYAYIVTEKQYWLSWIDFDKPTDAGAPEKLYLLFPTKPTPTNFVLRITSHFFDDGDTVDDIALHRQFYAGEVFELDVSVTTLFGSLPQGLKGYDVQFRSDDGTYYSRVFSFMMDYNPLSSRQTRYFLFKNSMGAFECVRFFGISSLENSYKRESFDQSALREYSEGYTQDNQMRPELQRILKLSSGFQCRAYIEWLQDLMESTQCFEFRQGVLYPVRITQDKLIPYTDSKQSAKVTITVEYMDHSLVYQPDYSRVWSTVSVISNPYS